MADLVVEGDTIVTMDRYDRIVRDGAVAINDGKIIAVGPRDEVVRLHKGNRILQGQDKVIIPGLINVHTHSSEKLIAGLVDDLDLYSWLHKVIYPMMMSQSEEDCYWSSLLAQVEMIKSGITCFSDLFDCLGQNVLETLLRSVEASGMRAVVGRQITTKDARPDELNVSLSEDVGEKMIADTIRHIERGKGQSERTTVRFGIGNVSYTPHSLLLHIRSLADELDTGIHLHVAESIKDVRYLKHTRNTTPVRYAREVGLLGPDMLAAHCVWVDDEEIGLLRETGTKVAYNPVSNMKLADGVAPVWKMIEQGVTVGLGTDGAGSNDNLDMFACMKMGAYLQKVSTMNPVHLPSKKVLEMATIGGARALQMEDRIGSIEVGKNADLTVIDVGTPNMTPVNDVVKQIACSCQPSNVDTVIIDGTIVLEDRNLTRIDETATIKEAKYRAAKLVERMYGQPDGLR
jgi:5-methylthioadenosine/S-adenosylhomocysteine deaminase